MILTHGKVFLMIPDPLRDFFFFFLFFQSIRDASEGVSVIFGCIFEFSFAFPAFWEPPGDFRKKKCFYFIFLFFIFVAKPSIA